MRRVIRYEYGVSPYAARNLREKCAGDINAARAMAGTSSGSANSRSMRSRARRRCARSANSSGVMRPTVAEVRGSSIRIGDSVEEDVGERCRDIARGHGAAGLQPQIGVVVHAEPRERGEAHVDVTELTGFDAGFQNRFDAAFVRATTLAKLVGPFGGQRG